MQTQATMFLDTQGVEYELHSYDHDPGAQSFGLEAAEKLGVEPALVFKTLMAALDGQTRNLVVAIVPVEEKLNLKALARSAGAKRAEMATVREAEKSSGYVAGGISPFGQKNRLRTFVDQSVVYHDRVYVSAGRRGVDLSLKPSDMVETLEAEVASLT